MSPSPKPDWFVASVLKTTSACKRLSPEGRLATKIWTTFPFRATTRTAGGHLGPTYIRAEAQDHRGIRASPDGLAAGASRSQFSLGHFVTSTSHTGEKGRTSMIQRVARRHCGQTGREAGWLIIGQADVRHRQAVVTSRPLVSSKLQLRAAQTVCAEGAL